MNKKIKILSERTINQIAAGEVVENPASVVKELIENAIDSGADKICIETLGGGYQMVRVSDNGSGMVPDDAILCLERHATSKIDEADDLFSLDTMGFRGEALASIAAISKMNVLTAVDGAAATCVQVEGGRIICVEPNARAQGTTVEVRSLFYNVPARKKFQKTAPASTAEITKTVTQLALAHPEVGFELIQQERSIFSLAPAKGGGVTELLFQRSALLLGEEFHLGCFKLHITQGPCELKGVIGSPLTHRHNRSGQYLFVNRRPVMCPLISYAVRDAYATRLPSERHPIYALHLTLPPHLVDVNVHPQKKQIRLRDEKLLRSSIQTGVQIALQRAEQPESVISSEASITALPFVYPNDLKNRECDREEICSPIFPLRFQEEQKLPDATIPITFSAVCSLGVFSHYLLLDAATTRFPGKSVADGLMLVDLQAAQARIAFDSLIRHAEAAPISQGLLIPLTVRLSLDEAALVEGNQEDLRKLGIDMHPCGKNTFLIDALPAFADQNDAEQMVREVIETLQTAEKLSNRQEERLRHLARGVCRFARARKKMFMLQEAEELFKQLILSSSPYLCPHGKSTMIHVSENEIEAKFFKPNPNQQFGSSS